MKKRDLPARPRRQDRLIRERVHDPYKTRLKLPEPTVCSECGAVFHDGRWQWISAPADAHQDVCAACHRIKDKYPAGEVTIEGDFVHDHREEIVRLARHQEEAEKGEHPLHRIMAIENRDGGLLITTTDIHLPRRIGEAVHRAYRGTLDFHYDEEGYFIRVDWRR